MLLIVPTYRRHSNNEAQTFDNVSCDVALTLVVREKEQEEYRQMLSRKGRHLDELWVIPEGEVSGIATTRQWIMQKAKDMGEEKIVMIDDDLHFISRGKIQEGEAGWDYKLRPCDVFDFLNMCGWIESSLNSYSHAAVSMREGNNRVPGLHIAEEATRGIRVVGYNVNDFFEHDIKFRPEVEGREDLDVTLQLLRSGRPNIVTYHWAQGQRSADAPGGLEGTRDGNQLDSTAELLAEMHPGFVKTRKKFNKSGAMAGWRTEVTVYWKKALKSGI